MHINHHVKRTRYADIIPAIPDIKENSLHALACRGFVVCALSLGLVSVVVFFASTFFGGGAEVKAYKFKPVSGGAPASLAAFDAAVRKVEADPAAGNDAAAVGAAAFDADSCGAVYRGVLDPASVVSSLDWANGANASYPLFTHAVVDKACPKWLRVDQNYDAGAGHRLRQLISTLWVVKALPPSTKVAFGFSSLDAGRGPHHEYTGFDEFLGLTLGEKEPDLGSGIDAPPGFTVKSLTKAIDAPYAERDQLVLHLEAQMSDKTECNVVYQAPKDHWIEDHSTQTRGICVWKYAAAAKKRADSGQRIPLRGPDAGQTPWDAAAVHVGVHYRVNDGLNVQESALAGIISGYVLPALAAADVHAPIAIHVFTESEGIGKTPSLDALVEAAAGAGLGKTTVYVYGSEVSPRDALWMLSQTDIFVGSVSSFTWIVAQFSSRPASLLQKWDLGGPYKWCLTGMGCCEQTGACDYEAKALLAATAHRLAKMERCGQLTADSWKDEGRLPTKRPTSGRKSSGLVWSGFVE